MRRQRIIVVEDDPSMLSTIGRMLRDAGYLSDLKARPEPALEDISKLGYWADLLLTDQNLRADEKTGAWLVAKVKAARPNLPCILMSADNEPLGHRADLFIYKPFRLNEFEQAIAQLLASK